MINILELVSKWLTLKSHILIHNNPEAWGFVFIWYSNKSLSVSFKRILSKKILLLLKIERMRNLTYEGTNCVGQNSSMMPESVHQNNL